MIPQNDHEQLAGGHTQDHSTGDNQTKSRIDQARCCGGLRHDNEFEDQDREDRSQRIDQDAFPAQNVTNVCVRANGSLACRGLA